MAEPEITTMSQKGQVVIPQALREKLGIKPKTRLLVYGYQDTIVLKKAVCARPEGGMGENHRGEK